MGTTLKELAASGDLASRGAAALIEVGYADSRPLKELTPGSVTRTLAEAFARELAKVHEQLGEVYESAFLETATGDSVEIPGRQALPTAGLVVAALQAVELARSSRSSIRRVRLALRSTRSAPAPRLATIRKRSRRSTTSSTSGSS